MKWNKLRILLVDLSTGTGQFYTVVQNVYLDVVAVLHSIN